MTDKLALPDALMASLEQATGVAQNIQSLRPVGGGCINDCQRVQTQAGTYFLKRNDAHRFPGMFAAEAAGLEALRHADAPPVPEVLAHGEAGDEAWLWLAWLEAAAPTEAAWEQFGRALAALHRISAPAFGSATPAPANNYIGSLPQHNGHHAAWPDFYRTERLAPLSALAGEAMPNAVRESLEVFGRALDQLVPSEPPALVHGDLWSGNVLACRHGSIALVDPAVHMGNREADLAMTRLFGGFPPAFYAAYHESYPLLPGWESRVAVHQVYPLLVHGLLFGGRYWHSLQQTIQGVLAGRGA